MTVRPRRPAFPGARAAIAAAALVLMAAAAWLAFCPAASALDVELSGRTVRRDVLALYDSRQEPTPTDTRIHRFAEMPLNWLGYVVHYADVNAELPDPVSVARYRAVLTWFIEPLRDATAVAQWVDQATAASVHAIIIGDPAPGSDRAGPATTRALARLGLAWRGDSVTSPERVRLVDRDATMIGFERAPDAVLPGFPMVGVMDGATSMEGVTVHLAAEVARPTGRRLPTPAADAAAERPIRTVLVATGPRGGYAAADYAMFYEPVTNRQSWIIDPFRFFARSLGADRFPVPDVTTLSGRRMYFSHIDGDGWNNVSEIEGFKESETLSSEVVARELIERYPDLPVTVGVIAGDIQRELGGNPKAIDAARRLFALPQVELGSHTFTHPFTWEFYERYDRDEETRLVDAAATPALPIRERLSREMLKLAGRDLPPGSLDKYIAGSDDLPRSYLKNAFDLSLEVGGAVAATEALAPPGKTVKLYQWSGDTLPFEEAIRATRRAGLRNINGGDSRFDGAFPSVSYVPPIARTVGREVQIYAAASNENTYTNDWSGPYYGFATLGETLDRTEQPRRLKPFNVYYHMFSGEKPAALAAVKLALARARSDDVIPVAASRYAAIADAFAGVDIEKTAAASWIIRNRGDLDTVRFDAADSDDIDLAASLGVLGATRHEGALYVALDAAIPAPRVVLASRASAPADPRARLVDSRWRVSALSGDGCTFAFKADGYGTGAMRWHVVPSRVFDVVVLSGLAPLTSTSATSGADGQLVLALRADAIGGVDVKLACREARP